MSDNIYNSTLPSFRFVKTETVVNLAIYDKFINWVTGEFDLHLMSEEDGLKVYFPNGFFSIRSLNKGDNLNVEIKVEGKSKISCGKMVTKLQNVFNRVSVNFQHIK